ncbi:MAG: PqiC family protein [Candidatus Binatia bacterium]
MAKRIAQLLALACVAAAATGCSASPVARFYTLASTATADEARPAVHGGIVVGPVSIPAAVDRPQFVIQVAPNRVEVAEFHRWAAPLHDGIARAVAGDLAQLLGTPDVATAPVTNVNPTYRVTIDVQRFDATPGDAVRFEAVWTVRQTASGDTHSGRTVSREAARGTEFDALAAAYSRALATMSGDIAVAIRAAAGKTESAAADAPKSKPRGRATPPHRR